MTSPALALHLMEALGPWQAVAVTVLALPAHAPLRIQPETVTHPKECGFYGSVGLNLAARRHYRHALEDGRGLHVQVFRDHYRIHWDRVDPSVSVLRHFLEDVTRALARPLRRLRRSSRTSWVGPSMP